MFQGNTGKQRVQPTAQRPRHRPSFIGPRDTDIVHLTWKQRGDNKLRHRSGSYRELLAFCRKLQADISADDVAREIMVAEVMTTPKEYTHFRPMERQALGLLLTHAGTEITLDEVKRMALELRGHQIDDPAARKYIERLTKKVLSGRARMFISRGKTGAYKVSSAFSFWWIHKSIDPGESDLFYRSRGSQAHW